MSGVLPVEGRHPGTVHFAALFVFEHLPPHLRPVSRACAELAADMVVRLPDGPELSAGLRRLLEAKDCFVRAAGLAHDAAVREGGVSGA